MRPKSDLLSLALVVGMLCSFCLPIRADEPLRELMQVSAVADDGTWEVKWTVSEQRLKATPEWRMGEEPPLSLAQAVKVARNHLKRHGLADDLAVQHVTLQVPMQAKSDEHFYLYFISFDDLTKNEQKPGAMDVLVLLDGTVVTPTSKKVE